ncbi:MAG: MBL fold metallo-hydrolase [Actinomycetota bacterium]|nr:MBL fold metallo-hydrolase [Actinomycetota bacterium]
MTGPAPAGGDRGPTMDPGVVCEVAPGVRRLVAPNPGIMTGPGTNTYLVGEDRVAVVDPGPDDDAHLDTILAVAGDRLGWVVVTHTHVDHSPLSARLAAATGAQVLGFGPAPPGTDRHHLDAHDLAFAPDRRLGDGDRLTTPEATLTAVHTPGHASNHLCFELAGTGLLFSGDHVMAGSTVVIAPPDGDMAAYLNALERVRDLRPRRIAPGHGMMIDDPGAVLDSYLTHRRSREVQVLAGLRRAGAAGVTPADLVGMLYTDVPIALHPVARYSVWAHLRKLGDEGRAAGVDPDDLDAPWWDPAVPPPVRDGDAGGG